MPNFWVKEALDVTLAALNQLRQVQDAKVNKLSDYHTVFKLRYIEQWALVKPLTLDDHLDHVNQVHAGRQVPFVRANIDHTLDDSDWLVKHRLRICDIICDWQGAPFKVGL